MVMIRPSSVLFGPFSIFLVCAFLNSSFGTLCFLRGMAHFHLLHYNSCKNIITMVQVELASNKMYVCL